MKYIFTIALIAFQTAGYSQAHLNVDSLFNWQDPSLPSSNAWSNTYNEIWGYYNGSREYGIIGSTMGTHIFDVTDPSNSEEVAFIEGALTGPGVIHRDYHDYDDYLYIVCDEGASTLQIVDLRQLPDTAILVYDSDALLTRSHNIFIDTSSARMYVCGGNRPFSVFSLADPTSPTMISDCGVDVPFWGSIGYVHDVFVRGDTAYLNAGPNGLFVVDFRDINNIQMIGSLDTYTQQGYNHSGWLMDNKPIYALADETHGMDIKILDVSDLSDINVTDTIGSDVHPFSIPHNLIYNGDFLYVSYYFDGLYIFDCTNAEHPTLFGYYDTSQEAHADNDYRGCWGVYPFLPSGNILASDMQSGFWVLNAHSISGMDESDHSENELHVFPNPTGSTINVSSHYSGYTYRIINASGQTVLIENSLKGVNIDVSFLANGLYTLILNNDSDLRYARFVKR